MSSETLTEFKCPHYHAVDEANAGPLSKALNTSLLSLHKLGKCKLL